MFVAGRFYGLGVAGFLAVTFQKAKAIDSRGVFSHP